MKYLSVFIQLNSDRRLEKLSSTMMKMETFFLLCLFTNLVRLAPSPQESDPMFKSPEDDVAEPIQVIDKEVEQDPEPEQEVGQDVDQEVKQNRRKWNWFQKLLRRLETLRKAVKMVLEEAVKEALEEAKSNAFEKVAV